MKNIYVVSCFDTKSKRIMSVVRKTEKDALDQIKYEVAHTPHDKTNEKIDYTTESHPVMAVNEHNAYVKDNDGTEWFWETTCISETVFTIQ